MGLGGEAAYLVHISNKDELLEAVKLAENKNLPLIMIGGGSNIVWRDEGFQGVVLVNEIMGYATENTDNGAILTVGAGEIWDHVVERSVQAGLTGIEALSLIPGTAGGTPVQNVGAYGQEISETLVSVEAYDLQSEQFINLPAADCNFSYRNSRFKSKDRGRYLIVSLTLHLTTGNPQPPFYGSVQAYFDEHSITSPTPKDLRDAVVYIRSHKLPDPKEVKNTGSFFGNPIIPYEQFVQLQETYDLPHWPTPNNQVKLSAAWLIEQAGFKDFHDPATGMATWPTQSLVLVNEQAKSTADLLAFKQKIIETIEVKFGLTLVQEPELLP